MLLKKRILTIFFTSIQLCNLQAARLARVKAGVLSVAKTAAQATGAYVRAHPYKTVFATALTGATATYAWRIHKRLTQFDHEVDRLRAEIQKAKHERDVTIPQEWARAEKQKPLTAQETLAFTARIAAANKRVEDLKKELNEDAAVPGQQGLRPSPLKKQQKARAITLGTYIKNLTRQVFGMNTGTHAVYHVPLIYTSACALLMGYLGHLLFTSASLRLTQGAMSHADMLYIAQATHFWQSVYGPVASILAVPVLTGIPWWTRADGWSYVPGVIERWLRAREQAANTV